MIDFYRLVSEQVVNLTPVGATEGPNYIVPRYEGWVAGLMIMGVARESWRWLIEDAEFVHGCIRRKTGKGRYYNLERDALYSDDEDPGG